MSYSFMFTDDDGSHIYIRDDQKRTCIGIDADYILQLEKIMREEMPSKMNISMKIGAFHIEAFW